MSGPKNGRGDAFDDFFGDPTPSGRMGPVDGGPETERDDEATRGLDVSGGGTTPAEPTPGVEEPTQPAVTGAVPEAWWAAEPEPAPTPAAHPTWQAPPAAQQSPQPAQPAQPGRPARQTSRQGISPFALVAMLLGGVLLGGLFVGGALLALDRDDEPVASHTTVTQTSDPTSSTSTPSSTSSSSPPSTSSSSSSPTRTGELPAGATQCAGPKSGTAVGRGSEVTSCAFAVAVRDAYIAAGPKGDTRLEVRSPVTNTSYTMSCSGQAVTRCTGGNNAVVVLY